MAKVEKDEQFYMTLVTIRVKNRLFKVPRQALVSQSKIFRDMFLLPQVGNVDGSSDENPIRLRGIGITEFKRFLEVLFMSSCEETTKNSSVFDMWFPVLKLAQMWVCDRIYNQAVENMPYHLVCKSPAEKVGLAVKYDIKSWLLPGVQELVKRKEPLGMSDFEHLGADLTLKIASMREALAHSSKGYHPTPFNPWDPSKSDSSLTLIIKRTLHISDDVDSEMSKANAKARGIYGRPWSHANSWRTSYTA